MKLDLLTLLIAGCFVATLSSILLALAWTQMRFARALLMWSGAHFTYAVGIAFLAVGLSQVLLVPRVIGGALVVVSTALVFAGTRRFFDRRQNLIFTGLVVLVGLSGAVLPFPGGPQAGAMSTNFAACIVLLSLSVGELWRAPQERLIARWPLMAALSLHALIFVGGIYAIASGDMPMGGVPPLSSWFGMIYFDQLIYVVVSATCMVILARECMEMKLLAAAHIDSLTGAMNRGAFFARADRLLRRATESGTPLSLIAFDLDHFKVVNDTHGHAVGDGVLKSFAGCAAAVLRPGDLFGRIGGEEFAALLPGASPETAYVIADRVRHAFDVTPKRAGESALRATVSAGVATTASGASLEALLDAADRALYRAKDRGRNRVERAADTRTEPASNIIRVA